VVVLDAAVLEDSKIGLAKVDHAAVAARTERVQLVVGGHGVVVPE
jgi:hypothetical protein